MPALRSDFEEMTVASPNNCLKTRAQVQISGIYSHNQFGTRQAVGASLFEIPLRCQGDVDFHWEIGVLPAHGLLEIPPGSISTSTSPNLPTAFLQTPHFSREMLFGWDFCGFETRFPLSITEKCQRGRAVGIFHLSFTCNAAFFPLCLSIGLTQ